jgi:hypothetical protein
MLRPCPSRMILRFESSSQLLIRQYVYRSLESTHMGWSDITLLMAHSCPVQRCRNPLGRSWPLRKLRPESLTIFTSSLRQAQRTYAGSELYSVVGTVKCTDDKDFDGV